VASVNEIENQGQIGLQMGMNPLLQRCKTRLVEPATAHLIGVGGVGETVGYHPLSGGQGRFDQCRQMFAPGGEHQHGFGFEVHRLMEQELAELFAKGRAARLARLHDGDAAGFDERHGRGDLAALAGTVDAFEGDEAGFHG